MTRWEAVSIWTWWLANRPEIQLILVRTAPVPGVTLGGWWPDMEPEHVSQARWVLGIPRSAMYSRS